jgi:cell division protein DivIC
MKFSKFIKKKWIRILGSSYLLILLLFIVWMLFFDTNSFFIHNELNEEIEALENNKEFYRKEMEKDKEFLKKMEDSNEIEDFARQKYFLKKENEDIFIIEHEDSINKEKDE